MAGSPLRRLRKRSLHRCFSSDCQSTSDCRIAKVCFQLELRANLCFQISTAGDQPAPQMGCECARLLLFTANLCFQPCKPLGEVTLGAITSQAGVNWGFYLGNLRASRASRTAQVMLFHSLQDPAS